MTSKGSSYLKVIDIITGILLIIGGLNWGLVGFFGFNLVDTIFGSFAIGARIVYALVGLSALYEAVLVKNIWHRWECSGFVGRSSESPAAS